MKFWVKGLGHIAGAPRVGIFVTMGHVGACSGELGRKLLSSKVGAQPMTLGHRPRVLCGLGEGCTPLGRVT